MEQPNRTAIIRDNFNTVADAYDSPALRFFTASAAHLVSLLPLDGAERVIDIATGTSSASS